MTTKAIPCPNEGCNGHLYFWDAGINAKSRAGCYYEKQGGE
mgnify:CR=1 FL=1